MAYPDLTLQPSFTVQSVNERMVRVAKRIQKLDDRGHLDQPITLSGGVTGTGTEAITVTVVTNANLVGPITSVGNTTAVAAQTGTGSKFVMDTAPTIVSPRFNTNVAIGRAISTAFMLIIQGSTADNTLYAFLTQDSGGNTLQYTRNDGLTIFAHGGVETIRFSETGAIIPNGPVTLKGYTVATLPAGTVGMSAYVTDALGPAYRAVAVGGGAVVAQVFFDGAAWRT